MGITLSAEAYCHMPEDVLVKGWFEQNGHTHDMLANLRAQLSVSANAQTGLDFGSLAMELKAVADEDWAENWKQYYKPFRIGKRLVVKPSWEKYREQPGDLVVELDPGMAFGTGTHETTGMCMELLDKHLQSGVAVIDVGTGSGILAIAAARLGAQNVLAVDIDPDAVKVAKENVAHNGVEQQVRVVRGDLVNGETMGVPSFILFEYPIVYNPAVAQAIGLKQDEIPTNLLDLLKFVNRWDDEYADRFPDYQPFYATDAGSYALSYLNPYASIVLEMYKDTMLAQGQTLRYDTPLFDELLQEIEP